MIIAEAGKTCAFRTPHVPAATAIKSGETACALAGLHSHAQHGNEGKSLWGPDEFDKSDAVLKIPLNSLWPKGIFEE